MTKTMNTEIGRCGSCAFWGKDSDVGRYRICLAVVLDAEAFTDEEHDRDDGQVRQFREAHPAVVMDADNFRAALICRAEFGCVLHEVQAPPRGPAQSPASLSS
jgi:hypothetical protein